MGLHYSELIKMMIIIMTTCSRIIMKVFRMVFQIYVINITDAIEPVFVFKKQKLKTMLRKSPKFQKISLYLNSSTLLNRTRCSQRFERMLQTII